MATFCPRACSGDMYTGVPMISPARVSCTPSDSRWVLMVRSESASSGASMRFASPQSSTRTSPNSPTITLSGLRSRCTMPWRWAKAMVSQTWLKIVINRKRGPAGSAWSCS